ncbi:hypothetical protein Peur_012926 [Populus x canadensis]
MSCHPFDQSRNASMHRKTQPLGTHFVSPSISGHPRVLRTLSSQKWQSMIALADIATERKHIRKRDTAVIMTR